MRYECPVCLTERLTKHNIAFVFNCGHHVCSVCDLKLIQRNDLRCPTCRAVRQGYTEDEAEVASTHRANADAHSDALLGTNAPIVTLTQLIASGASGGPNAIVVMNIPSSSVLDFEQGQGMASEVAPFEFASRARRRRMVPESGGEQIEQALGEDPDHPLHAVRDFLHSAFNHLGSVSPAAFRQQLDDAIRASLR